MNPLARQSINAADSEWNTWCLHIWHHNSNRLNKLTTGASTHSTFRAVTDIFLWWSMSSHPLTHNYSYSSSAFLDRVSVIFHRAPVWVRSFPGRAGPFEFTILVSSGSCKRMDIIFAVYFECSCPNLIASPWLSSKSFKDCILANRSVVATMLLCIICWSINLWLR